MTELLSRFVYSIFTLFYLLEFCSVLSAAIPQRAQLLTFYYLSDLKDPPCHLKLEDPAISSNIQGF